MSRFNPKHTDYSHKSHNYPQFECARSNAPSTVGDLAKGIFTIFALECASRFYLLDDAFELCRLVASKQLACEALGAAIMAKRAIRGSMHRSAGKAAAQLVSIILSLSFSPGVNAESRVPPPEVLNQHSRYNGCTVPAQVSLSEADRKQRSDRDPEKIADALRRIEEKYPELRCDRRSSR